MNALLRSEEEAHRTTVETDLASMVDFLQEALGQRLLAYIADVSDPRTVGRWAAGDHAPRPDSEDRIRIAFQVFQYLQAHDSHHTVRAWLIGLNPQLDDVSPATAIRGGRFKEVAVAARSFAASG